MFTVLEEWRRFIFLDHDVRYAYIYIYIGISQLSARSHLLVPGYNFSRVPPHAGSSEDNESNKNASPTIIPRDK